ncbi:uncharacterized protein RCH25_018290 [Pelodytes ibericus]
MTCAFTLEIPSLGKSNAFIHLSGVNPPARANCHGQRTDYCIDQPYGVESFVGDSVTLPCRYVYPKGREIASEANIVWKVGDVQYCEDNIYNSSEEIKHSDYQDRISFKGNLQDGQNGTISIRNLKEKDTTRFCCRVQIRFPDHQLWQQWQTIQGTKLTVRDKDSLVIDQPHFIPALTGDTVTIPCLYSTINGSGVHLSSVQWSTGDEPHQCTKVIFNSTENNQTSSYAYHVPDGSTYLQIKQINSSLSGFFCCKVEATNYRTVYSTQRVMGTQLIISGEKNELNIIQPKEVFLNKSVTINCSFTEPQDRHPAWVGIYWVVEGPRDVFAYHPNQDLIHKDYKGKTRLVGKSNLLLENFEVSGNITFYCRVAVRLCITTASTQNKFKTLLEEGAGTLLINVSADKNHSFHLVCPNTLDTGNNNTLLIASVVVLLLIAISILAAFLVWKKTEAYNTKTDSGKKDMTSKENHIYGNTVNEDPEKHAKMPQEGYHMVYASINHRESPKPSKPKAQTEPDMVYAEVKTSVR